jgi:MoaA/NifB/PqqE/SkfB family radical SAM enzyme
MVRQVRRRVVRALPPELMASVLDARVDRFRTRHGSSACLAPLMQMHLLPDGDVRACCRNAQALGNIAQQRLPEIWAGAARQALVRQLGEGCFEGGCASCGEEVAAEGRRGSYPSSFDVWSRRLGYVPSPTGWPNRLELNLSNTCNLQCIQCSGDLSSSIRIHREHRPPLPAVYGDQFFDDLAPFLPHVRHANFAGGEPFLASENFRVWDLIADVAPDLECTVCTNLTQWSPKVEAVLDRLRMHVVFSLDGVSKDTFEGIRQGADLDRVLANVERFRDHARARGTSVEINHCLMPQNYAEFGDLLRFAEERDIHVNVSVVRTPEHASLFHLPDDELRHVVDVLDRQDAAVRPALRLNRITWERELARIRGWAADAGRRASIATSGAPEITVTIGSPSTPGRAPSF